MTSVEILPDRADAADLGPADQYTSREGATPPAESRERTGRRWLADLAALAGLSLVVLASFRGAITGGLVAYEADTLRFYYPLERWFAEQFKSGHFPLWNPYIFGGYPIFGDGELGFAYPLHLFLLTFLSGDQTYIWLRISTHLVAAAGMFALCRSLHLGPLPAVLGGVTFSLGSFLPAQAHHEDMTRSVAWTPLAMACVEWGLQRRGMSRLARFTAGAVAVAMSGLGLHPQGLAMSLLAVSSFVAARILMGAGGEQLGGRAPQAPWPGPGWGRFPGRHVLGWALTRLVLLTGTGLYVVGLGLALAAVQLLPVADRGAATFRASQPAYLFATSYAFPPINLIDLLFPYFYRGPDSQYWSLWSQWETTLYVGILPLALGVVGIARARRGPATYFLLLSLGGLWLAFANYVPLDLYERLWNLPGFSAFRVPGRYTFLFVLGWAVLAAYGAHALGTRVAWNRWRLLAAAGGLALAVSTTVGLAFGFEMLRSQVISYPQGANEIIRDFYLTLRHHEEGLFGEAVFQGLIHSLDITTPRTAAGLLFFGLAGLTLATAILRGSLGRGFQTVFALLAAADLLTFTSGLHYELPVEELAAKNSGAQFLAARADRGRIFVPLPISSVESNRLVPYGVQDIGGYSSLESRLNFSYWSQMTGTYNRLMELANVRYLVHPSPSPTKPSFNQVSFDPEKPLLIGSRGSIGGSDSWSFSGHRVTQVRVIGALTHAFTIPQDAIVAEVRLLPKVGEAVVVNLRAGVDLAEWAYDRPDAVGKITHDRPRTVAFRRPDFDPVSNTSYTLYLWHSFHDLGFGVDVERVEVRYVYPRGSIELYGLGLFDDASDHLEVASQRSRSKFTLAYRDPEVEIYESRSPLPQAYVVSGAIPAEEGVEGVGSLLYTPFDPRTSVVLDDPEARGWARAPSPTVLTESTPREVAPVDASTDRATYRVESPTDGFLFRSVTYTPQWRALVDGVEQPVLRANYLFQAVPIPPGAHTVEFKYEPQPVRIGLTITAGALGVVGLVAAGCGIASLLARRRRPQEGPSALNVG